MKQQILFVIVLCLIFLSITSSPQTLNQVTISGVVRDAITGKPIPYVLVKVIDENDTTNRVLAKCDWFGNYAINPTTDVISPSDDGKIIFDYQLMQNYPNPFNPSTVIQFRVPKKVNVQLTIYNILGQKVKTLVNRKYYPGSYSAVWDATDEVGLGVSAGLYLYRLQAGDYVETKKMILLDGSVGNRNNFSRSASKSENKNNRLLKPNNLVVTIRANSARIQSFEQKHVPITSQDFTFDINATVLPDFGFDKNNIVTAKPNHDGKVYISGLTDAVLGPVLVDAKVSVVNERTRQQASVFVDYDGSFSIMNVNGEIGDQLSFTITSVGKQVGDTLFMAVEESMAAKIRKTSPPNGDKDILLSAPIIIYFTLPMDAATITNQSFTVTNGGDVSGSISISEDNTVARFTPDQPLLTSTTYTITLTTDITSMCEIPLEEEYTFTFTTMSEAATINVPADQPTIQAGIDAAKDGDIVLVAEDTYYENINFKGKAITVAGHFFVDGHTSHTSNTIIDGSQPSHPDSGSVVYFVSGEDTTSVLSGFTITNGTGTLATVWWMGEERIYRKGGGIFCTGGSILFNKIINNTIIEDDDNAAAGGIAASFGDVIIQGNHIINNTLTADNATNGGGLCIFCNGRVVDNIISYNSCVANNGYAAAGGLNCVSDPLVSNPYQVVIEKNKITHNSATSNTNRAYGGGLFIRETNTFMLNNDIRNNELSAASNRAYGAGMTMWSVEAPSLVNGNTFTNNVLTNGRNYGGGLYLYDARPLITNNIISFNSANRDGFSRGGGICFEYGSNATIINNTITNNDAYYGGGLQSDASTPAVINTIVWANQAGIGPGIHFYGQAIDVVYSDIQGGWSGEGNIEADPLFADTLFHLAANSPCIDAGVDSIQIAGIWYYCPKTDLYGNPRPHPIDDFVDIGALESEF